MKGYTTLKIAYNTILHLKTRRSVQQSSFIRNQGVYCCWSMTVLMNCVTERAVIRLRLSGNNVSCFSSCQYTKPFPDILDCFYFGHDVDVVRCSYNYVWTKFQDCSGVACSAFNASNVQHLGSVDFSRGLTKSFPEIFQTFGCLWVRLFCGAFNVSRMQWADRWVNCRDLVTVSIKPMNGWRHVIQTAVTTVWDGAVCSGDFRELETCASAFTGETVQSLVNWSARISSRAFSEVVQ